MKKLTYEFIKSEFEKEGYTLLSTEYINNRTKLNYRCSKGHEHNITWYNIKSGQRCPTCARNVKPTLEQVKKYFEQEGYTLLSKEYINAHIKLDYHCPIGHKHNIRWSSWQQGSRCPTCAGNNKLTINQVRTSFEKERYTLLSKEYTNSLKKLNYICSKGHKHGMIWGNWQRGKRCPTCKKIKLSIIKSGSGNSNWNGGSSYEPYCPIWKDKEYKQDIKLRDGNKCLNPICSGKDSRLHIHHIDYNKKNCEYKNVVTLCGSCNSKANTNREWYTAWYRALMYRRYNYEYY